MSNKIFVDSIFFIEDLEIDSDEIYTTQSIIEELKSLKSKLRFEALKERIRLHDPRKETIKEIIRIAERLGEPGLSKADIDLLASAYEFFKKGYDVTIVTNDFSIQNIAFYLKMKCKSIGKNIEEFIEWIYYCKNCKRTSRKKFLTCPYCGSSEISRRPHDRRKLDS